VIYGNSIGNIDMAKFAKSNPGRQPRRVNRTLDQLAGGSWRS
jgi:hypothetical protein